MKEKQTTIPPAGAASPRLQIKTSADDGAAHYRCRSLLVPVPDGPPYAWHYFAIFVGVIVGLIFEPCRAP
jgi:L-tartrate/succinate antiporter